MNEADNQNIAGTGRQAIFRYNSLKWVIVFALTFCPFLVALCISADAQASESFLSLLMLNVLLLGGVVVIVMYTFGLSDIIIDERRISRSFFGKIWQIIEWKNVRLITAFPVAAGRGSAARAFNIYPMVKPRFYSTPSGKMVFNDKVKNAREMVGLINHYALKHGIRIETTDKLGGKLEPVSHL